MTFLSTNKEVDVLQNLKAMT